MTLNLKEQGPLAVIKMELAVFLKNLHFSLSQQEIVSLLERPRDPKHGHLALPLFLLAKKSSTSPKELAQKQSLEISKNLPPFLKQCNALSGFLNFRFQEQYLQNKLQAFGQQKQLAYFKQNKPEHWLMDFASPNVAKYMNIGHLRATVLGQALVNLARAFGFKVTALNHLGDWGSQFGKLLWAYKKWATEYDFKHKAFESLVKLYVRFFKEAELGS